jgi:CRISPR-associated Csx3 family protein
MDADRLNWTLDTHDPAYTHVRFAIPGPYLDYDTAVAAPLPVPAVAPDRGVVLDGRLPNWLYAALARVYDTAAWVGVYETRSQPPHAIVVRSRLERLPIGGTHPIAPARDQAPVG